MSDKAIPPSIRSKKPTLLQTSAPSSASSTPPVSESPRPNIDKYPINLSESYSDSPIFRRNLLKEEELCNEFSNTLKNLTKTMRSVSATSQNHSQTVTAMATEAMNCSRPHAGGVFEAAELEFERHMQTFASAIHLGEEMRSSMFRQFEELGIKPTEALQEDIKDIREVSKKYVRICNQTDASVSKITALKKNSNKLDESEGELSELKKQQASLGYEFGCRLNTLAIKRRLEVLDSLCTYLELHQTFIDQYQALMKDFLPQLRSCRVHITSEREALPESLQKLSEVQAAVGTDKIGGNSINGTSNTKSKSLQGYLFRKGKMGFNRRQYFVLNGGEFTCFETIDSLEPKWKLDLLICSVKPSSEATRNFCFDVISPYKSCTVQAESQEMMNKWITAIQDAIGAQLDKQRLSGQYGRGRTSSNPAVMEKAAADANAEAKKREAAIQELYQVHPDNKCCADCGDSDPQWISINLGILICLECSGVHRSMGTHISKVRSLTLDKLGYDTKAYIKALGNSKVNQIFLPDAETSIPHSLSPITPASNRKDRESWIKAKYVEKVFVETFHGPNIQQLLLQAISEGDAFKCLKLYAQGANLNYKYVNEDCMYPIHFAASARHPIVLEFLLQNGAQVNSKDVHGSTPLHIVAADDVVCAALICRHKARIDIIDDLGKSAFDVAMNSQSADIITLLRLVKLAKEEHGGMDDKSFSAALDAFTAEFYPKSAESTPVKSHENLVKSAPTNPVGTVAHTKSRPLPATPSKLAANSYIIPIPEEECHETPPSDPPPTPSQTSQAPFPAAKEKNGPSIHPPKKPQVPHNNHHHHHHHHGKAGDTGPPTVNSTSTSSTASSSPSISSSFSFISKLDSKK